MKQTRGGLQQLRHNPMSLRPERTRRSPTPTSIGIGGYIQYIIKVYAIRVGISGLFPFVFTLVGPPTALSDSQLFDHVIIWLFGTRHSASTRLSHIPCWHGFKLIPLTFPKPMELVHTPLCHRQVWKPSYSLSHGQLNWYFQYLTFSIQFQCHSHSRCPLVATSFPLKISFSNLPLTCKIPSSTS